MSKRLVELLVAMLTIGSLAACSGSGSKSEDSIAAPEASKSVGGQLECWDAAEGDGEVAGHQQWSAPPAMTLDSAKKYSATLETSAGNIEVQFFPEEAPKTVNNFVCLGRAGYFDGTPFHRIIKGFVIQGGDPTGTGTGGPGYRFEDEPVKKNYTKGVLAMANAGPNTNGSQFFIVVDDLTNRLPKNYTIFGEVTSGMDVVDALANTPVGRSPSGEVSKPVGPVTLDKVTIHES